MVSNLVVISLFIALLGPPIVGAWLMAREPQISRSWLKCLGLLCVPTYVVPSDWNETAIKILQTYRARTTTCSTLSSFALLLTYAVIFSRQ